MDKPKKDKPVKASMRAQVDLFLLALKVFNAFQQVWLASQVQETVASRWLKKEKLVKASMRTPELHSLTVLRVLFAKILVNLQFQEQEAFALLVK